VAAGPLRITEGAVTRNEWSKTTAKNARVDARERHLWLVRKGGVPRGVCNPVIAVLPGPLGTSTGGWASEFRGVGPPGYGVDRPDVELLPPHFRGAISGSRNRGALMRQLISSIYGALLIAIWIGVMAIVIAVLDSGEPKWLLVAAGFVAATITVTLVQEFIEWRSRPRGKVSEASPVKG
jgi:hypothetical protein